MGQELLARLRRQVGLLRDYFAKRRVINAVQVWIWTAFARVPDEGLYSQALFQRFEEQFDLPALLVDRT
jgi:hypothetical protein